MTFSFDLSHVVKRQKPRTLSSQIKRRMAHINYKDVLGAAAILAVITAAATINMAAAMRNLAPHAWSNNGLTGPQKQVTRNITSKLLSIE